MKFNVNPLLVTNYITIVLQMQCHTHIRWQRKFIVWILTEMRLMIKLQLEPRKPSVGKTNKYRLKGKGGVMQIQVYNSGNKIKPYELNMYKEGVELGEQPEHEITVGNYTTKFFYMCGSAQKVMKEMQM